MAVFWTIHLTVVTLDVEYITQVKVYKNKKSTSFTLLATTPTSFVCQGQAITVVCLYTIHSRASHYHRQKIHLSQTSLLTNTGLYNTLLGHALH